MFAAVPPPVLITLVTTALITTALATGAPAAAATVAIPQGAPAHGLTGLSAGELAGLSPADSAARLARIAATGARWVRFDVRWDLVEPIAGQQDWSSPDAVVREARRRGMGVLPLLTYTPTWARRPACADRIQCAPQDPAAFARFAAAAAARYLPQGVRAYEIWNEPNTAAFWGTTGDPEGYGRLLSAVRGATAELSPAPALLVGGLAPAAGQGGDVSPADFVSGLYTAGAGSAFDGVAMHAYSYPALPGEGQSWSGWTQMRHVHDVLARHGDGSRPVWISEIGAPTGGTGGQARLSRRAYSEHPDHVDEEMQAQTVTATAAALPALPWVGPAFWYGLSDRAGDRSREGFFGLLRSDGSAKPSYRRFAAAVAAADPGIVAEAATGADRAKAAAGRSAAVAGAGWRLRLRPGPFGWRPV